MTNLTQRLTAYGADMVGALERFVDDEDLYADCLRMFLEDPSFAVLGDALARRDCESAFDAAHTLKGVSGNLGLTPLFHQICDIVEPLRHGQCDGLDGQYQEILAARAELEALLAL